MANTVSALKRVRMTERRTAVNRARKARLRLQIRAMRILLQDTKNKDAAVKALPKTFSVIDRAAKNGLIKKNTASRYKSRLSARVKAFAA